MVAGLVLLCSNEKQQEAKKEDGSGKDFATAGSGKGSGKDFGTADAAQPGSGSKEDSKHARDIELGLPNQKTQYGKGAANQNANPKNPSAAQLQV